MGHSRACPWPSYLVVERGIMVMRLVVRPVALILVGLFTISAPASASRFEKLAQFALDGQPISSLIVGADGKLYGTAQFGGAAGFGSIFSIDPASPTPAITTIYSFKGPAAGDGAYPRARLLLASDGNFYGTTSAGGGGFGTAFRLTPSGAYTLLTSFPFAIGVFPDTGLVEMGGNFYGTTPGSRTIPQTSSIYRLTPSGGLTTFLFQGANAGVEPAGGLTGGADGKLYGTTSNGGSPSRGVVYRFNPVTGVITTLYSFQGSSDGANPRGDLLRASDGFLYGVTTRSGAGSNGAVFRFSPSTGSLSTVASFRSGAGFSPASGLIEGADGNFYGTTPGVGGLGSVFKVTPAGALTTEALFDGLNGAASAAAMVLAPDGAFYGTTSGSVANGPGDGTIFKFTPGSPATLTRVAAFGANAGPYQPVTIFAGADGSLYGVFANQGGSGFGSIFRLTTAGALTTVAALTPDAGSDPTGLIQAADGSFYGTTASGGAHAGGTVYNVTSAGAITAIFAFTAGDAADGAAPRGGVIQASDGNLYGTTSTGGANGSGTVFKIALGGGAPALTTLFSFDSVHGANPSGPLAEGDDGNIYGTTELGGAGDIGTVFRITPAGDFTTLAEFTSSIGSNPLAGLTKGIDGNFYGTTSSGPAGTGTVFRITPSGTLTLLTSVPGVPRARLAAGSNGSLYGTSEDGNGSSGALFRITPTALVRIILQPSATEAARLRDVAFGGDGLLYGVARAGGDGGGGVVFRIVNAAPVAHDVGSPAAPLRTFVGAPPLQGSFSFSDTDDDFTVGRLDADIVSQGVLGSAARRSTTGFTYTPNPGAVGDDSFVYRVTDPMGASSTATVFISIRAQDAPPTISSIPDV